MAKTIRPRVFFDANVLYSALHSPSGAPAEAVALHANGRIDMVVSNLVLTELVRTVRLKLPLHLEDLRRFLAGSPPEVVPNPSLQELRAVRKVVNPKDAPIIAAALTARVDYLLTGDRTFIAEARRLPATPPIMTPREFIEEFTK